MLLITGRKYAGNICPNCLQRYTDWTMIKGKAKTEAKPGEFTGIMYEIAVDNINKLVTRNKCPHCNSLFNMNNIVSETDGKWGFQCPTCSVIIQVVR